MTWCHCQTSVAADLGQLRGAEGTTVLTAGGSREWLFAEMQSCAVLAVTACSALSRLTAQPAEDAGTQPLKTCL